MLAAMAAILLPLERLKMTPQSKMIPLQLEQIRQPEPEVKEPEEVGK